VQAAQAGQFGAWAAGFAISMALGFALPVDFANPLMQVGVSALKGAAIGALSGGVASVIAGGSFGAGALQGAMGGAQGGAISGFYSSQHFKNWQAGKGFRSNAAVEKAAGVNTPLGEQNNGSASNALNTDGGSAASGTQALSNNKKAVGPAGFREDIDGIERFHLTIGADEPLVQKDLLTNSLKTLNARLNVGRLGLVLKAQNVYKAYSSDYPKAYEFFGEFGGALSLYSAIKTRVGIDIVQDEINNVQRILIEH
jgi:hypothetical protein